MSNNLKKSASIWFCLAISAGTSLLVGCGGSEYPVARVSGRVTCEGKAVPGAWVFFEPLVGEDKSALVGKQGFAIADENGKFVISTYGTDDGAVIGKHKVHVTSPKSEGGPPYKCNCEFDSAKEPFLMEVKAGKNEFDLVLPILKAGASKNRPMTLDERDAMREAQQAEQEAKANAKANGSPTSK